ncbi:dihydrofolate reductase family protein [Pseudarthrobacter sp. J1763]|uniref:dihydrofolate reductase family protein n=1 Tax=Pseudarthrobacter sp. J1763 TaxID=3420445 RepID=UPI003D2BDADF
MHPNAETPRLIYSAITSLDGYVADEAGDFQWSAPNEEVHAFINEQERSVGVQLLGRRTYNVMDVWDELYGDTSQPQEMQDFANIWHGQDKVVYSHSAQEVSALRTRWSSNFEPEAIRELIKNADSHVGIGGPTLGAEALKAGLVQEIQQYVNPVIIGGGLSFLPQGLKLDLRLVEQRTFANGVVFLRYEVLEELGTNTTPPAS